MAAKKCLICNIPFCGRRDAKTCSARCRKRLQKVRLSFYVAPVKKQLAKTLLILFVGCISALAGIVGIKPAPATAATSSYLNFQSRLLTNTGTVVADGTYNIEFKITSDLSSADGGTGACSGSCLWRETRQNSNSQGVRVVNGYLSVNLGSVTSFPSTINWDQQLYLTMNIAGTGSGASPTYDGEMSPRITLTAMPYAFRAGTLAKTDGSGNIGTLSFSSVTNNPVITLPNETGTVCTTGSVCSGYQAAGTYLTSTTGVQLQGSTPGSAQSGNFNVSGSGIAGTSFLSPLFDAQSSNGALGLGSSNAGAITIGNTTNSTITVKTKSSSTAFQVQNASSRSLLSIDSTSSIVSIGNTTDSSQLTLAATGNANATIRKNMSVTGSVNANDIVEIDTGNAGKVQQAAANSSKVFGVASTAATNAAEDIVISGITQVNCSGTVNIGDLLASSGTAGQAISVSAGATAAIGTVVGRALSTCSSNLAWAQLTIGAGGQDTLQSAYNSSNAPATITTTDNKNIVFNMADTSTDSNFLVNLQCATCSASGGRFAVQSGGTDVFKVSPNGGAALFENSANSTTAFQIQNSGGTQLLNIDSSTSLTSNLTTNLITNGSFEGTTATTGWVADGAGASIAQSSTQKYIGNNSLAVTTPATATRGAKFNLSTSTLLSGTQYTLTLSARLASGSSMSTFEMGRAEDGSTHSSCLTGQTVTGNGWSTLSCTFTTGVTSSTPFIYVNQTDATVRTFYIDGVQLTQNSLVANYSIEQAIAGNWTAKGTPTTHAQSAAQAYAGTKSLQIITQATANQGTQQSVTLADSTTYNLTFEALGSGTALTTMEAGYSSDGSTDNTVCITGQTVSTSAWTQYSCSFTTPSSHSGTPYLYIKNTAATVRTVFLDSIVLSSGNTPAAYRESSIALNGIINSPTAFQPQTDSTTAFQIQNSSGGNLFQVDSLNSNITINGANNGQIQAWQTGNNTGLTAVAEQGTIIANGYVYMIGGNTTGTTDTSAVQYAKLLSNGNVGNWSTTTALPAVRDDVATAYVNGYIYAIGGSDNDSTTSGHVLTTVYYAKVNADGTLSAWNTAANSIPAARTVAMSIAYNGYLYTVGGMSVGGTATSTVYYAKLNADGSVGAWITSSNALAANTTTGGVVEANGYLYMIGGAIGAVKNEYAKLNADGSTGAWTLTTNWPNTSSHSGNTVAVANGYVYSVGGNIQAAVGGSTFYAQLNSDGTIGSWNCQGSASDCTGATQVNTTALPATRTQAGTSAMAANGYLYFIGGYDSSGSTTTNTVYYTSTARTSLAGSLDLVGASLGANGNLSEGDSGGQLTAGDTSIVGTLNVQNQASFNNGVGINGLLGISGSETIQNTGNSLTNFSVQNGTGVNLVNSSTVNLVKNSSFESGATGVDNNVSGWSKKLGSETSLMIQNSNAYIGSNSMQIVTTTTAQQGAKYLTNLLPSTQYSLSFYALLSTSSFATLTAGRSDTGASGGETNCTLNSPHGTSNSTITTTYQRFDCTFTTGATMGASGTPYIYISKGANASIRTIYIDGVQLETASAATDFRNGDLSVDSLTTFKSTANSTTAFQIQNSSGGNLFQVDSLNSNITINGANNGQIQAWQTSSNTLTTGIDSGGTVTVNGYVYTLGGIHSGTDTAAVQYAKLQANGNVGSWSTTTSLPAARDDAAYVTWNGYIYVIAGSTNDTSANAQSTVYYAKVNQDGTISSWKTNSYALGCLTPGCGSPAVRNESTAFAYNGYLYETAGENASNADQATTYYAKINNDGSTGAWNTTTSVSSVIALGSAFSWSAAVANGYVYLNSGGGVLAYNKINADGTLGANWTNSTALPNAVVGSGIAIMNGYIYLYGGFFNGALNTASAATFYTTLNASTGAIGTWNCQGSSAQCTTVSTANSTAMPLAKGFFATSPVQANGYMYAIGGTDGASENTVYYASTARTQIAGSLDLVGASLGANGNLAEGDTGGQLTAGDTSIVGTLSVQNQASFNNGVAVQGNLSVSGTALFQNPAGSTTAFQIQNASGLPNISVTTANLVGNTDFESGTTGVAPAGWATIGTNSTITTDNTQADFGASSMKDVTSTNTNAGAKYNYPLLASTQYTLSFYAKVSSSSISDIQAGRADDGATNTNCFGGGQTVNTVWTRFSCTFTTGATISGTPYLYIYKTGASAETFYIDGVQLEQAAAATTYTEGNIKLDGQITFKNTANSTTAFQIQDASAVSLFAVDTTGRVITISGDTTTFANLTLTNAHFKSTQTTAPTIGTPSNCATSPTAAVASNSTDSAGSFRITSGTGGGQTTCDTIVTFNKAFGAAPKSIHIQAETQDGGTGTSAARQIYVSATATTTFTVKMNSPPAGASEVDWFYYWVVE
jgi:hypothetical protein